VVSRFAGAFVGTWADGIASPAKISPPASSLSSSSMQTHHTVHSHRSLLDTQTNHHAAFRLVIKNANAGAGPADAAGSGSTVHYPPMPTPADDSPLLAPKDPAS
jgi:hypothetical protein